MYRTTITLPQGLVDELVKVTRAKSKTRAVTIAIEEEIRKRKLENIKSSAGSLEFEIEAEDLRHGDERLG
ncbi:MAG: DUF2191 domain-containing protein [Dehalococcoidia bacterium]|nr:DUF2191 domain-containing protein [Dehalococcoidia bacterium]